MQLKMQIKIDGKIYDYKTIWMDEKEQVCMINQTKLPEKFEIFICKNYNDISKAIKNMIIRGAPAIGMAGALGIYLAIKEFKERNEKQKNKNFLKFIEKAKEEILKTRPTAIDLFNYVTKMYEVVKFTLKSTNDLEKVRINAKNKVLNLFNKNIEICRKIGENGEKIIKDNARILTHCNAGALATVDYGTALSVIRACKNKKIFVYVDETRPRFQGALTSFELMNEEIPHKVIVDNAAGYFMYTKQIDIVITGADRIALNGDVANKIGTYEKAVIAKENNIPFYVAAPLSTIDQNCKTGNDIPIEFRSEDEILKFKGKNIFAKNTEAINPAFDITPAKYITGYITEIGILKADELKEKINEISS